MAGAKAASKRFAAYDSNPEAVIGKGACSV